MLKEIIKPGLKVFYGPAASGKTNLMLYFLKQFCRDDKCIYVSTEGLDFLKRGIEIGLNIAKIIVLEALDLLDLLNIIEEHVDEIISSKIAVIDSINAGYRRQASEKHSFELFNYILAKLRMIAEKYKANILCTSQVHEYAEGLEAVGMKAINLWASSIFRVIRDDKGRLIMLEKPSTLQFTARFSIVKGGIVWESC